jgi:TRAP transporter TAXI family solute receptor
MFTDNRKGMPARLRSQLIATGVALVVLGFAAGTAAAQTYGFATLPPGSLNHTTATSIAKVLKEKGGMNVLVQPTGGDTAIIPMVGRGEAEIGISNIMETTDGFEGAQKDLRLIAAVHALRTPFFVRKDSPIQKTEDMKGKRVAWGYSAMRNLDKATRAMLATAGLGEADVKPVPVPNIVRGADDFIAGSVDVFFFAFGAPKLREVDATIPIRAIETDEKGMGAAKKIMPWGYLTQVGPGPVFTGVEKPIKVYSFDNTIFTNAKVPDETIYKILDTLFKNKDDLVAVQPVLREFTPAFAHKQYGVPYHPGALKYFKEHNIAATALP